MLRTMSRDNRNRLFSQPGWWQRLLRDARLCWRLIRDPRVPFYCKLIPLAGVIYLFSFYDLIPDFVIPGLGQVDDLLVLYLACRLFISLVPEEIRREYRDRDL